jgi:hypothetical protein
MQLSDSQVEFIARELRAKGIPISKNALAARSEIYYLLKKNRIDRTLLTNSESMRAKLFN